MAFDCHFFVMTLVYHRVEIQAANSSIGSISRKVDPSRIFQETNAIKMIS
jgi:hypothetical protein